MITIKNGKLVLPNEVKSGLKLVLNGDKISEIAVDDGFYDGDVINACGNYISPGFIDIHVHGGGEGDFMDCSSAAIAGILKTHTQHGTTGIYPTTVACSTDELFRAIDTIDAFASKNEDGAEILGIHLEGPYISVAQCGALDPRYIKTTAADKEEYCSIIDRSALIKRVTFAPELKGGLAFAQELSKRRMVASIGHSDAEYDSVLSAFQKGATHVTHLYSGMQVVHRVNGFRKLGVVESAFLIDDMTVEVIADGCHLPYELLKLIYKIKGPDKIALITDAMRATGRTKGESVIGSTENGQKVYLRDGVAYMPGFQAFAGSIATCDRLVRNMYRHVGVELFNAVRMASLTPARIMGCECRKGSLTRGKDGDVVIFDEDVDIKCVVARGRVCLDSLS
jgi:N-acetylglucosamine-6-phosphate deacetylase